MDYSITHIGGLAKAPPLEGGGGYGPIMRIVVDYDLCQSNALCMAEAPEVFEVRDDGFLYLSTETPADELRPKVEEAARVCPTQAITIED
jgi:ferredoxin